MNRLADRSGTQSAEESLVYEREVHPAPMDHSGARRPIGHNGHCGSDRPAPTQPAIHCYTIHEFTDEAAPVLVRARADALTVSVEYRGTFRSAVLPMAMVDPRGAYEATTGGCFRHTKRMWPWMAAVRPSSRR